VFLQAFSIKRNLNSLLNPPADHVSVVDGIRAIAVLIVIASHMIFTTQFFVPDASNQFSELPVWAQWPVQGFLGVDMFFVISGFLIGSILFAEYKKTEDVNLKRFFYRRFLRLMPLYWLALALSAFMVSLNGGDEIVRYVNVDVAKNVGEIWKNLLYINNLYPPDEQFGAMSHSWSLAVEEQFYFLFPLILLLIFRTRFRHHPVKIVIFFTIMYFVIRAVARIYSMQLFMSQCGISQEALGSLNFDPMAIFVSEQNHCLFGVETNIVFDNLYTKYFALFSGVVASYLRVFREDTVRAFYSNTVKSNTLDAISLVGLVFSFVSIFLVEPTSVFNAVYQTFFQQFVLSVSLVNIIFSGMYSRSGIIRGIKVLLNNRLLYIVSQLSYSMYLFNLLIVHVSYEIVVHNNSGISVPNLIIKSMPICVTATIVVSVLAYLFVEKPFMNLRSRSYSRERQLDFKAEPIRDHPA
jgi:peptidoglycan/LPS O-acetylase OafA/YrhL